MPKTLSNCDPFPGTPRDTDLAYVDAVELTPKDRKITLPTLARIFLHRALTHPLLSWIPGGDPVMVMARKGSSLGTDAVGLFDLQAIFKDVRTEILNIVISGLPATLSFNMGTLPGNARMFITAADPSPKLILSGDLVVDHTLIIHAVGVAEPVTIEYPSGTMLYSLQPGQTFVLSRAASGYLIYVDGLVSLTEKTTLSGTELVKLEEVTGAWAKTSVKTFRGIYSGEVPAANIILDNFNNGSDITLAAAKNTILRSYFKYEVDVYSRRLSFSFRFWLDAQTGSTTNTNVAQFLVPLSSLDPKAQAIFVNSYEMYGTMLRSAVGVQESLLMEVYFTTTHMVFRVYLPGGGYAGWKDVVSGASTRISLSHTECGVE